MKRILITGANGQLGNELRLAAERYKQHEYYFTDVDELDICNKSEISHFVESNKIAVIVNCAAYTNVDRAEDQPELCYRINHEAVQNIADVACENQLKVIHISTDYVFDGKSSFPYTEEMPVAPVTVYGKSKLAGERALHERAGNAAIIIRTSWLYSSFGNNFVKTMLRLGAEKDRLNVIFDQVGTPTYAADLADAILQLTTSTHFVPGIYHYSNEGVCSWYDFTKAILNTSKIRCEVLPIETKDYPSRALRPHYSVLNKHKIKSTYRLNIPHWKDSLERCLEILTGC
ncbi:MAG: dTDP-4-dehydrorhamnose reductase [Prevotellaceae bacterium]|jgi:dTDP-4-dehydrorhamnose reductase|nr:dTDP-4-dehydrorhamnose reductase [Prevotellaceae bacterium]